MSIALSIWQNSLVHVRTAHAKIFQYNKKRYEKHLFLRAIKIIHLRMFDIQ